MTIGKYRVIFVWFKIFDIKLTFFVEFNVAFWREDVVKFVILIRGIIVNTVSTHIFILIMAKFGLAGSSGKHDQQLRSSCEIIGMQFCR